MTLTKAQRARLEKLATYLEGLPADYGHFGMGAYFGARDPLVETKYARENGGVANCGTVACAVGHGPAAGILVPLRFVTGGTLCPVLWNDYAGLFVGTWDSAEYDWCFDGSWSSVDDHHHGAAARIRYLLDRGAPPPEMIEERAAGHGLWRAHEYWLDDYAPYRIDAKAPAND